jgi:hypothetical protein
MQRAWAQPRRTDSSTCSATSSHEEPHGISCFQGTGMPCESPASWQGKKKAKKKGEEENGRAVFFCPGLWIKGN